MVIVKKTKDKIIYEYLFFVIFLVLSLIFLPSVLSFCCQTSPESGTFKCYDSGVCCKIGTEDEYWNPVGCFDFLVWVEPESGQFTVGKKIPVNLYVKNIEEYTDKYNISYSIVSPNPSLIDVDILGISPTDSVLPGEVKIFYPRITIKSVGTSGIVWFNVTSWGDSNVQKNTSLTILPSGEPVSLDEFNSKIFLFSIVLVSVLFFYLRLVNVGRKLKKKRIIFLAFFLILFFFSQAMGQEDLVCDNAIPPCPTNNSQCVLTCGDSLAYQSLTNIGDTDYFNLTIPTSMHVKITVTQSDVFTNYDPLVNWTAGECPVGTSSPNCVYGVPGDPDTCENDIKAGTYIIGVKKIGRSGEYSIKIDCEEITINSTIISPEEKTYYTHTLNLTVNCTGYFDSYNVNRSLDNGENITFGFSIQNEEEFTNQTTLGFLSEGYHNVSITCYNGTFSKTSLPVSFRILIPLFEFSTWIEGSSSLTIGRTELINVYVRNSGNVEDSYNVSFRKEAYKGGNLVPQLLDVKMHSSKIEEVKPNTTRDTFALVTLLGPIERGSITFNVTSASGYTKEISLEFKPGTVNFPINLDEFEIIGLVQIIIFGVLVFIMVYLRD